jgi:hypothetical protein
MAAVEALQSILGPLDTGSGAAPDALREAAEVAATWAEGLRDDKGHPGGLRVAASVVGKRLRAALAPTEQATPGD